MSSEVQNYSQLITTGKWRFLYRIPEELVKMIDSKDPLWWLWPQRIRKQYVLSFSELWSSDSLEITFWLLTMNKNWLSSVQFSSVWLLSRVRLFVTPWIAARQASLSITNSRSSLRLTSIELMMPSSYLILCRPLLLLPPIPPSIRVFSNESTLRMR